MMDGISDVDIVGAEPLARRPVQVRLNTFENRGPDVVSRGMPRIQRIDGLPPISGPALKLEFGAV